MRRLLAWLNRVLGIVETDPAANAYYAWADVRLDHLAGDHRGCGPCYPENQTTRPMESHER